MNQTLSDILNCDPKKHLASLGFFQNYPVEDYFIEGESASILGRSNELWAFIASSNPVELTSLLAKNQFKTRFFSSLEEWMMPLILKENSADWVLTTDRYVLEDSIALDLPDLPLKRIEKSYGPYIHKHSDYKSYTSVDYIEDRLSRGVSAGLTVNNKLVAWGLTHDDGSVGFLHVIDKYRNKGFGKQILLDLIRQNRELYRPVFGNIVPENEVSRKLIENLGFTLDRRMSWVKLRSYP